MVDAPGTLALGPVGIDKAAAGLGGFVGREAGVPLLPTCASPDPARSVADFGCCVSRDFCRAAIFCWSRRSFSPHALVLGPVGGAGAGFVTLSCTSATFLLACVAAGVGIRAAGVLVFLAARSRAMRSFRSSPFADWSGLLGVSLETGTGCCCGLSDGWPELFGMHALLCRDGIFSGWEAGKSVFGMSRWRSPKRPRTNFSSNPSSI